MSLSRVGINCSLWFIIWTDVCWTISAPFYLHELLGIIDELLWKVCVIMHTWQEKHLVDAWLDRKHRVSCVLGRIVAQPDFVSPRIFSAAAGGTGNRCLPLLPLRRGLHVKWWWWWWGTVGSWRAVHNIWLSSWRRGLHRSGLESFYYLRMRRWEVTSVRACGSGRDMIMQCSGLYGRLYAEATHTLFCFTFMSEWWSRV